MQNNDDDMVIDHQVSVCACQMQIEGDNELDEDLDQGFCHEDAMDEDLDQGFCDEGFDQGFDYNQEPMDQDWNQDFAQSEIYIEFPEGASIGFTFVNGIRYLVLHSNM
jgi:hypothetical protein